MIDLPDMDSIEAVLTQPIDATLRKLLDDRLSDTRHCGLENYTHVLVIEEGDTESAVIAAIGFSPLRSRIDGTPEQPDWDWCERVADGWIETLWCVGNSGFAFIVLIEDADGSPFAALYRRHCA